MEPAVREPVFAAPTEQNDRQRMRSAHENAARNFQIAVSGPEVWGWQGPHTRAPRRGLLAAGALRPQGQGRRTVVGGHRARGHPRPPLRAPARLQGLLDWSSNGHSYRAELTEYVPVLPADVALSDAWWTNLRTALETLAAVPTDRESVRQRWIDNTFRRFLGIDPIQIHEYVTGHGDLHWANLTGQPLVLLDWENWGRLPVGYGIGLLGASSLTAPATAARIHHEFSHILNTAADRAGGTGRARPAAAGLQQRCPPHAHPAHRPPGRTPHRHPRARVLIDPTICRPLII